MLEEFYYYVQDGEEGEERAQKTKHKASNLLQ